MPKSNRSIGIFFIILFAFPVGVLADSDAKKEAVAIVRQYAEAVHQSDVIADAKRADAVKLLDAALDRAMKTATEAKAVDDANQIFSLRKALKDGLDSLPAPESISSLPARKALEEYQDSIKKTLSEQTSSRTSACKEYIAKLGLLVKRAMLDEDLAVANQIAALRQSAELELRVGIGRFPNDAVLLLTFNPDTVLKDQTPRIADLSGRGNDIGFDSPPEFAPAPLGMAMRMSPNKKLRSAKLVGISGRQPRTLSFWLEVEEIPRGELHDILSWGAAGNGQQFGAMISKGRFVLWGWGSEFDWNTTIRVEPKVWHHHAIVYDGSQATWYIDGKSAGTHRMALETASGPLVVGGIDGQLQEVAIYDRALSIGEINQLGHRSSAPMPATPAIVAVKPSTPPATSVGNTAPMPVSAATQPGVADIPINGEFFSLAGQAGLPQYLKCDQQLVGGADGVRRGNVRTVETDFNEKDFVLDIVFVLAAGDPRSDAVIGLGENDRGNPLVCHLTTDGAAGHAQMNAGRRETKRFADLKLDVPNLMRLEKKGDVLTFSVTADFKGKYRSDFSSTFPSIKSVAPQLNRVNSNLCFSGNAWFKSIRLEVEGKVVDPGPTLARFVEPPANEGWVNFVPGEALPAYLDGSAGITIGKNGLEVSGKVIRTKMSDYLAKDFTVDVVCTFHPEDGNEMRIGIGENGFDGGNWIVNSVTALMHKDGIEQYTFKNFYNAPEIGKLGNEHPGPNLLRFQKRGNTLLLGLCADYSDKYQPDFVVIIPSLKWQAPYLNDKNSGLFFGGGGTIQKMRLFVDGKCIGGDDPPIVANLPQPQHANAVDSSATKVQSPRPGQMFSLAATAGIPPFLHANPDVLADDKGISGGEVRTIATDLINHDFICDLLFAQSQTDHDFYFTLGDKIGEEAVGFRITGPQGDGGLAITIPHQEWIGIGKVGGDLGPHLLRVEKRGNTLTFSMCADFKDSFTPSFVRTVPDLKAAAPMLTRLNSAIYLRGNASIREIGLTIDGIDQNKRGELTPRVSSTSQPPVVAPTTRPALGGPTGPENFIKLTGPKLPAYFAAQPDLKFAADGLLLKDTHIHTRNANLIDKDFIFDTVFHFTNQRETMIIGFGVDERDGNHNVKSVFCRIESPAGGGFVRIVIDGVPDTTMGSFGNDPGPHLLRMQKHGNTLTFALCAGYKGAYAPDFVKTIPDLRAARPKLDSTNSGIFLADAGVAEQTRLIVDGEPTESDDIVLDIPARWLEKEKHECQIFKKPGPIASLDESAPKGMTLMPNGVLRWEPSHDQIGFHEFKIKIADKGQNVTESAKVEVVGVEDARAVGGDLAKIDSLYRIALENNTAKIFPGFGGKSLLILDGQALLKLGPDGLSKEHVWKLPGTYQFVGERKDYFVALSDQTKSLDFVDKGTVKITRSVPMDYSMRRDLCLHPVLPISYVAIATAVRRAGVVGSIVIVDENTGEVREPTQFFGTFLKTSADGTRLYAGCLTDLRQVEFLQKDPSRGPVARLNANQDSLIVYDISHPNNPVEISTKDGAGVGGEGLALSADGKRLSYLSNAGYPVSSNNISAWNPVDLTVRPVTYAAKANGADCKKLAFHPILAMAAAPSDSGAACFNQDSGEVQLNRLQVQNLGEVKVLDLAFSPDGKSLILECEVQGEYFLRCIKLNLNGDELAKIKQAGLSPVHPTSSPADK